MKGYFRNIRKFRPYICFLFAAKLGITELSVKLLKLKGIIGLHLPLRDKFSVTMGGLLFDDIFTVENLNPNGENFDKVTRIAAHSEKHGILMHLDVNTEIYPMKKREKLVMVLTRTLSWNETVGAGDDMEADQKSVADKFEYIMHGLLYKISEEGSGTDVKVGICASFGGLQMTLRVDPIHSTKFKVDQKLFLLIRKLP